MANPSDDDKERVNNLRAIAGMKTEKTQEPDIFGFIPSGGTENTLSPQENVTVGQLAKQAGLKDDPSNLYDKSQWSQIQGQAKQNLKQATDTKTGGSTTTDPESAYEELADAQANQYLAATKAIEPYTSGAAIPSFDESTTSGAEKMLGTSSTSPISQWLNQQVQAAQAQYAPTQAAGATVAQAEQAGEKLEAGGLQQMGQAETAVQQAAPYESLLQSLATDVPYKLLDNYNFSNLSKNIPGSVQLAESNLGITTAGQGTGGATPLLPPATVAAGGTPSTSPVSSGNPSIPGR